MPVGIVEVMNNTGSVLHYYNQQTGVKFDVQPTALTYGDHGYISTSPYQDDTVPLKGSNRKIIIQVDNNGPQFAVCDDWYKFSVIGNGKSEAWTGSFSNGDQFVMRVDDHDVKFVKYDQGLRANDAGYLLVGGVPSVVNAFANAVLTVGF